MSIELYTYADAYEHLVDVFNVKETAGTRDRRLVHRAIQSAYRELPNKHNWEYFNRRYTLNTAASQSDGTIAYTHSTRTVTLTGATWPTDAANYRLYLASDNAHYPIESYTDATNIVLPASQNPGADVASGTDYILSRIMYPFPCNFRKMYNVFDVKGKYEIQYVEPARVHSQSMYFHRPQQPSLCTIRADGRFYGALSLEFSPPPNTIRPYDFIYRAAPRPIRIFKENTGTVSYTAASTAVTGVGTAFAAKHVGSVIRLGDDGVNIPTEYEGDEPYAVYRIVAAVANSTNLTLDAVPGIAGTTFTYEISDPIDLTTGTMYTYFLRECEAQFAILSRQKDMMEKVALARDALDWAADADARHVPNSSSGDSLQRLPFHLWGWSTIPDEIVNASL